MRTGWVRWAFILVAAAYSGGLARAQGENYDAVQIEVTHVAGSIYLLEGGHAGNVAASVGADGIVLVDAMVKPLADKLRNALQGLSGKPVRFVVNTHYHGDHTRGNEAFARDGAVIIAHHNVRGRLERGGVGGNFGTFRFEYSPEPSAALPVLTFEEELRLHLNGEEIRVWHVPGSHTDGDSIVFFPRANVVHVGDEFVTYGFPDIEIASGGSVSGTIGALEQLLRTLPADVKIIPGHGPVSSPADVRKFIAMLRETQAAVRRGMARGMDLEQLKRERVLEPWKTWAGFFTPEVFTEFLYNDLKRIKTWTKPVAAGG